MPHDTALITILAVAFGLALGLGFVAVRLRLPALVGYLVTGVIIGPATPGFVADAELSRQLAEIGVMLLMFGVGLHFRLEDLVAVRRIAVPGALLQIGVATGLGVALARFWGWSWGGGLVFGLALSVASTVVLLRALEDRGLVSGTNGRIAVGWLLVEDLVMVLVLVLLPPLARLQTGDSPGTGLGDVFLSLGLTFVSVGLFVTFMLVVGRRLFPWLLWQVARTGSRELFTLCAIAAAIGIAYGSSLLFGVSFALGAFFAGMVLGESSLSHRAAEESLPLRDAFAVLFFVSVGMLFDPRLLLDEPLRVLAVLAVILVGKSLAAFILVMAFRYPLNTALTVSVGLAQIGEFSFILAGLGVSLGLLPDAGVGFVLAGAMLSIALNPLLFGLVEPLKRWILARSSLVRALERPGDPLAQLPATVDSAHATNHVVLVGFGRVGRRVGEALLARGVAIVVAEENREIVEGLRARNVPAVAGDAAEAAVLIQAHIARARILVITTPDTVAARKMIELARLLRPQVLVVVRAHSDEEAARFAQESATQVFFGEHELAAGISRHVLGAIAATPVQSPP